jgi:transcriptional regulator with XRE-family HTH domain
VVFREFAVLHKNGVVFLSYLSEKIKEFQEKRGIRSVRAIATESGVPVSTLYDVLKERTNNLSVDNSQKLADYMGITVDELYGKEKSPDAEAPRDKKYDEIFSLLASLPDEKIAEAVRYLKYLAEN